MTPMLLSVANLPALLFPFSLSFRSESDPGYGSGDYKQDLKSGRTLKVAG